MHMQPDHRSVLDLSLEAGVRFQGKHAASMEAAERAMYGLSQVQERDVEVFVDMLNSQLPGVLLHGIWCFLSWLAAWGLVCVLLFLHRWSALVGWLSVFVLCLLGLPAVACAVTPFPTISSLCNSF